MRQWLTHLICLIAIFCFAHMPFAAAEDLSVIESITFNQMPAFQADGNLPSLGEYAEEVGYDIARSWAAGELPADVVQLGDIVDGLHPEEFLLSELVNVGEVLISDIPLISDMPLAALLDSIPFSGEWPIADLPEIGKALSSIGIDTEVVTTLREAVDTFPEIAEARTGDLFGDLPASNIPNLETSKIADFEGFQAQPVSSVPGLADIALGDFPNPLDMLNFTAQQDIAFGEKEYSGDKPTPKPVSGTVKEGFQVPCVGGCPHIELSGPGWHGDQWMTKDHRIADGRGLLGGIPGFDEAGAYRLPFGESFALQITGTDEKTGAAEWGIAFRVCSSGMFFDLGCTAYALEVPLGITTYEKDTILTGIKDGRGGASEPVEAPPGWAALRPETPPELQAVIGYHSRSRRRSGGSLCGDGPGGVKFNVLSDAYGYIEGNYASVGSYVDLGGKERGYGIGKYQYMTYRSDVRAVISAKPGGDAFLKRADAGSGLSAAEVEAFFTPAEQDALFKEDQLRNIQQAMDEGFSGSRLIERMGQIHYGGSGAPIDGNWADLHGRLTLKTYGEELAHNYQEILASSEAEGKCKPAGLIAGKTLEEAISYEQSPGQDFDAYRAYRSGYHAGIDFDARFGAGEGGEVVSLSGGEVVAIYPIAKNRITKEDSMSVVVVSTDSEGREIQQTYTHLSASSVAESVQVGDVVSPGQAIGLVGGEDDVSRGAHLDYKVMVDGVYVSPDEFMQAVIDGGGTVTTINVQTGAKGTTQVGAVQ